MACEGQDTGASKENQGWLKLILVKTVVVRRLSQKNYDRQQSFVAEA